ncbi:hypothetical protein HWV62_24786 [Athelia sp. TMB]|nr:hypothetical protein HWV62_24786 [Athelia sp. TMB]
MIIQIGPGGAASKGFLIGSRRAPKCQARFGGKKKLVPYIRKGTRNEATSAEDLADDAGIHAARPAAATAWKGTTLAVLFGGIAASRRRSTRLPAAEVSAEAALMEALADIAEDSRLDEGAIEIDSDEEYAG